MPTVQCPECFQELLQDDFLHDFIPNEEEHVLCGRCGREVYVKLTESDKKNCPKCDEISKGKECH
ncbi:MAG: hypothetical protein KQH63_18040 [Desulfobulbaceae bacterium]|nr:hypothetical protein [Desulfobulbaceae bacterium]